MVFKVTLAKELLVVFEEAGLVEVDLTKAGKWKGSRQIVRATLHLM